jgi:hypothetical protein
MSEPATLATAATSPPAPPAAAPPQPAAAPKPITPAAEWADLSPNERSRRNQVDGDRLTRAGDPATTIQVRGDRGEVIFKDRATGQVLDDGGAVDPNAPPIDPATTGEKFKVGQFEVTEAEIGELMAEKAARDLRTATIPPTPADYKLEISPEAKLPGDVKFQFDANDPGLTAAKAWAHSKGLDQSSFSEMLTLYASHVAQQNAVLAERARTEIAKAGVNAGQRVDAVGHWIRAEMGDADAKPILATIVTDAHLRFYEKIHQKIVSQGAASFSQQHRDAEPRGVDDATWAGMSYGEKKAYAERASTQRNGRR